MSDTFSLAYIRCTDTRAAKLPLYIPFLSYVSRVKKTSLGESLAGNPAYNPIRDSWQDSRPDCWQDVSRQKVSPRVSPRVSDRIVCMTPGETRFFTRVSISHFVPRENFGEKTAVQVRLLSLSLYLPLSLFQWLTISALKHFRLWHFCFANDCKLGSSGTSI